MAPSTIPENWANTLGMKFHLVRSGVFTMGSPKTEARRFADEDQHVTTISQDFFLSVYQMTQAQWRAVTGENPSRFTLSKQLPVENVSWIDCQRFLERLNAEEYLYELTTYLGADWRYSLPTEAQWEYACRAGTVTSYYFGDQCTGKEGNFGKGGQEQSKSSPTRSKGIGTLEVGSFPPNPWGFYDMCGNLCEWTSDNYGYYETDASTDPVGGRATGEHVARGGSWRSIPDNCRSASRFNFLSTYRGDNCGLRLALTRQA
ncbi:MAG: formylglycine-generating enzyme family protein [Planctomycetia bacterium]|nr:formylglycine-generating enzyme family protein [Planctomycetia bacterium]